MHTQFLNIHKLLQPRFHIYGRKQYLSFLSLASLTWWFGFHPFFWQCYDVISLQWTKIHYVFPLHFYLPFMHWWAASSLVPYQLLWAVKNVQVSLVCWFRTLRENDQEFSSWVICYFYFFFLNFFFVLFMCLCECVPCVCRCPGRPEKSIESPGVEVKVDYKPSCMDAGKQT